jgi:transcriptional regulator with XRE-family HTH domain
MLNNHQYVQVLKKIREQVGLTQKQVEEKLQLRSLSMRDFENGRLKLPVTIAMKLSELYQVSIDQLVGGRYSAARDGHGVAIVQSLFSRSEFSLMFIDPIIRAYLEDKKELAFDHSLFEIFTQEMSAAQVELIVEDLVGCLAFLASVDGKISENEVQSIKLMVEKFKLKVNLKSLIGQASAKPFFPQNINRIELKHFCLWTLFFFIETKVSAAKNALLYIEKLAEHLKVNRRNFIFIQNQFIKEEV